MAGDSRVSSSMISLPKGGGAIGGLGETFTPDPFRGTGNFSVPVGLSEGRDGFSPQISLEYSTGNGNGPFGIGWRLTVPEVVRSTRKGLPRYTDGDTFMLDGADDLVRDAAVPPMACGEYSVERFRPRTEGMFARIEYWQHKRPDHAPPEWTGSFWRVISSDNVTSIFGATSHAVLAHPEYKDRVFRWYLELVYDGKGNYTKYTYKPEDESGSADEPARQGASSNLYLKQISYGNLTALPSDDPSVLVAYLAEEQVGLDCAFNVILDFGEHGGQEDGEELITGDIHMSERGWDLRPDAFSTYTPGFEVRTRRLCKRLLMVHNFPDAQPLLVGSCDFAYRSFEHNGVSGLTRLTQRGYRKSDTQTLKRSEEAGLGEPGVRSYIYEIASMPPLEFEYSVFEPVDSESLARHLLSFQGTGPSDPVGLHDPDSALIDLFGRGLSDILETRRDGYRYWRNLGQGRFSEMQRLDAAPRHVTLAQEGVGLSDISGDGCPDILEFLGQRWGYYPGRLEGGWGPLQTFQSQPGFSLADPNLTLVDLTGDGSLDALRTDLDEFVVYECAGAKGFSGPKGVPRIRDLRKFPDVHFTDPRVHVADVTGDGLADIVMIEDGKVHYWPNLGFGRFGARITTEIPGLLHFEPEQMFLVDIDGSGPADLVQVESGRVSFWMNQSGNGWSARREILGTPPVVSPESVKIADMLGTGTAGILWSSPAGLTAYRYLPLTAGAKPGLLTRVSNNMGLTTRFSYRASTEFAAAAENGRDPGVDHLPFAVHVLSRVETVDHIAGSTLTTEYEYAHGRYDQVEREFVGFGRVDQRDAETAHGIVGEFASGLDQPPVLRRTWYHTGVGDAASATPRRFAHEYYAGDPATPAVPDTTLPDDLITEDERRQALRALRGRPLRQETYGLDSSAQSSHPYALLEHVYGVRRIQHAEGRTPLVFSVHEVQTIEYHYERNPADPRVMHQLALEVDEFDHVTLAAQVAYPRRTSDNVEPEQAVSLITATATRYAQRTDLPDGYRHGVPVEQWTFQITGIEPATGELLNADRVRTAIKGAAEINYEDKPADGAVQKRPIARVRHTYWDDEARMALPAGQVGLLALPHNTYEAAFTPGLLRLVYGDRLDADVLVSDGGYVFEDDIWWRPSGHPRMGNQVFDPSQFYRPVRTHDAFGNATTITYDRFALLVEKTIDPLGNVVRAENDYRVLQPKQIVDANGNRQAVAFDALGTVVGTAVMGKEGENLGDSLDGFLLHLDQNVLLQHIAEPLRDPELILGKATSRVLYDPWRYYRSRRRTQTAERGEPIVIYTLMRETHESDLRPGAQARVRHSLLYQDGFGRSIQTKVQAEPGLAPARHDRGQRRRENSELVVRGERERELAGTPFLGELKLDPASGRPAQEYTTSRWAGTGRKIYNNKGKPVKQYEPFFSATHFFEEEREMVMTGVTPILFYDPLERVVATLLPNHTYEKVVFGPWQQTTWDVNDTLKRDPQTDPDVMRFLANLPEADYHPTWYERMSLSANSHERSTASRTEAHADTPTVAHFDTLGRPFLTVSHNGFDEKGQPRLDPTRVELDIEGNQRAVIDALGRVVMRYDYDMLGNRIRQDSADAGRRWTLRDAAGKAIRAWDERGFVRRMTYDPLQRPVCDFVSENGAPEFLAEKTEYGDSKPDAPATNHLGRIWRVYDGAGIATSQAYDFKGNLVNSTRQLLQNYQDKVDWAQHPQPALETEVFGTRTVYDALNRPMQYVAPHSDRAETKVNILQPVYNEASLLEQVHAWLNQSREPEDVLDPATANVRPVINVDYDAKGQRTLIEYGNGVKTEYEYDRETYRLIHTVTTRPAHLEPDKRKLQDLSYTYDPGGNITHIEDQAQKRVFFDNECVDASSDYKYDALYRLIAATGREHRGQDLQVDWDDRPRSVKQIPYGNTRELRRYVETYRYDAVGNILQMVHHRGDNLDAPGEVVWNRRYQYRPDNNQLRSTSIPGEDPLPDYSTGPEQYAQRYTYDAHGNMTSMPHLQVMQWDVEDQLQMTQRQKVNAADEDGVQHQGERTWYVYDSAGQRVRKATQRATGQVKDERIYLGGFEVFRRRNGAGATTLERETLHIMDDKQRIALVETRTLDNAGEDHAPAQLIRYQLGNHLSSACLELDDQARVISYEEYYPYGSTSYQAVCGQTETSKRYRYTGKERDEESGLYYHGARYYAPCKGRWISVDPEQDQFLQWSPFCYTLANPIGYVDPTGTQPNTKTIYHRTGERQAKGMARVGIKNIASKPHVWLGEGFYASSSPNIPGSTAGGNTVISVQIRAENIVDVTKELGALYQESLEGGRLRSATSGRGAAKGGYEFRRETSHKAKMNEVLRKYPGKTLAIRMPDGTTHYVVRSTSSFVGKPSIVGTTGSGGAGAPQGQSAHRSVLGSPRPAAQPEGLAPPEVRSRALALPRPPGPGLVELDPRPSYPLIAAEVLHDVAEAAHVTRDYQTWKETLTLGPGPTLARLAYEAVEGAKMTPGLLWRGAKAVKNVVYERFTSDRYTFVPWKAAWWPF